jgi:UDP-glucose 4-epimerase
MKVLITGGAGNIGISLIENLISSDIEVAIFDLKEQIEINKNRINSKVEIHAGSILEESDISSAIKNCTHVVHLAAALGVRNTEANKKNCLDINILGTKNILDAAANEGVLKFLFASSSETYGEPLKTPISEDSITQGKTVYAVSKLAGEEFVKAYSQKYTFMKYSILRFFNVFGPNQVGQFVISKFIQNAKENKPIIINGDGNQERAYCYVDDAIRGLMLALKSEKANGEVINIGNPNNLTSINELAHLICKILNIDSSIIQNDLNFKNTDRKHEREIFIRYPEITKAKSLLDYEPKIGLEEALKNVIEKSSNIRNWPTEKKNKHE